MLTAARIKAKAADLGFDACGIAPAVAHPELGALSDWLARGHGASMAYLARSAAERADVRQLLPSARAVIVTATVYNTNRPYSTEAADPSRGDVARYAWGDDYHDVVGTRLDRLLAWMRDEAAEPFDARAFVDTGPVQERVYARHAGVGWIGRNTCVIHPQLGSWIFLGEIVCSLPLDADDPAFDQCGSCTLCLEACPTQALVAPGVLDSRRCISYWTIEHRGAIPAPFDDRLGSHVFGCDICQEVCPWNALAPVSDDAAWQPRPAWDHPRLAGLLRMTDGELGAALQGSAMRRAKVAGLRRNITLASRHAERQSRTGDRTG